MTTLPLCIKELVTLSNTINITPATNQDAHTNLKDRIVKILTKNCKIVGCDCDAMHEAADILKKNLAELKAIDEEKAKEKAKRSCKFKIGDKVFITSGLYRQKFNKYYGVILEQLLTHPNLVPCKEENRNLYLVQIYNITDNSKKTQEEIQENSLINFDNPTMLQAPTPAPSEAATVAPAPAQAQDIKSEFISKLKIQLDDAQKPGAIVTPLSDHFTVKTPPGQIYMEEAAFNALNNYFTKKNIKTYNILPFTNKKRNGIYTEKKSSPNIYLIEFDGLMYPNNKNPPYKNGDILIKKMTKPGTIEGGGANPESFKIQILIEALPLQLPLGGGLAEPTDRFYEKFLKYKEKYLQLKN